MKTGLLDPTFVYIPSTAHDHSPNAFRRRMRRRQREAELAAAAASAKVQPIVTAKKQAKA
jgi:hypothetical protein